MGFFEAELRTYLERVAEVERLGREVAPRRVDEHALRMHLLDRLGALEATGERGMVEPLFREWSPRIAQFARYIASLPSGAAPGSASHAQAFAEITLDVALGAPPARAVGLVERLELERIAREFRSVRPLTVEDVERYAMETYLVCDDPVVGARLTALGTAFLRLRGRDAIRWLITSEVLQSTGRWDRWRTPRELLEAALRDNGLAPLVNEHGEQGTLFDPELLDRLADLGVLYAFFDEDDRNVWYRAADGWRDAIRTILGASPWHQVIAAILAEDRTGFVPAQRAAAEDVSEQTKLIAHEVRNALIPARIQLDALRGAVSGPFIARVDAAKRGVTRVLTFVEEMLATSELIAEPSITCDLAALVREAIRWLEGGERIQVVESTVVIRVRAPRTQLVRAMSNVFRNALQATSETQRVETRLRPLGSVVQVIVDDAGPGVPPELREQVFWDGYTTRTDGSGYGLAYVRRVVADRLRGRVWCEPSHLRGARFVIELPGIEVEP